MPLNAKYQHFNGSGIKPARLASVHNLPFLIKLFRNEDFIFGTEHEFPERLGPNGYFKGEGQMIELRPGRHQWETNFVADITNFTLKSWAERGKGSSSLRWVLSDCTLGCHTSQIVPGTYKKAHRHTRGTNVFTIDGQGYSMLWYEGKEDEMVRVDWDHGVVVTPPEQMFHQHFNTGSTPSRYLAVQFGTVRYPMITAKVDKWASKNDMSYKLGGNQVEYEDQPAHLHKLWLGELDKNSVESENGRYLRRSEDQGSGLAYRPLWRNRRPQVPAMLRSIFSCSSSVTTGSIPNHSFQAGGPWWISMPRPLTVRLPRIRAAARNGVSSGV